MIDTFCEGDYVVHILLIQNYIHFLIQPRKMQLFLFYLYLWIITILLIYYSVLDYHYILDFNHSFKSLSFRKNTRNKP